jgi:hypothetical protein
VRTLAAAVGSQRLTASAMARPTLLFTYEEEKLHEVTDVKFKAMIIL